MHKLLRSHVLRSHRISLVITGCNKYAYAQRSLDTKVPNHPDTRYIFTYTCRVAAIFTEWIPLKRLCQSLPPVLLRTATLLSNGVTSKPFMHFVSTPLQIIVGLKRSVEDVEEQRNVPMTTGCVCILCFAFVI